MHHLLHLIQIYQKCSSFIKEHWLKYKYAYQKVFHNFKSTKANEVETKLDKNGNYIPIGTSHESWLKQNQKSIKILCSYSLAFLFVLIVFLMLLPFLLSVLGLVLLIFLVILVSLIIYILI